jgi:hypothetical protein
MTTMQELSGWKGQLVMERIEDGQAHIELLKDGNVERMVSIDSNELSDNHFHDGMAVAVEGGDIVPLPRESAERERYIKEKVQRMGRSMDEINGEKQ